jgi:hypothetical protein
MATVRIEWTNPQQRSGTARDFDQDCDAHCTSNMLVMLDSDKEHDPHELNHAS